MRNLFIIFLFGFLASGCAEYDIEGILLERSDISVTVKGKEIYSFNPNKAQICVNAARNEYRMFDEDFLNRVILRWNEKPVNEGQVIIMDIDWGTKTSFKKENGLSFTVQKIDGTGKIWLWNESDKIGIVIKDI